jgi:catechol 2,3-dioxygenase-like lactoylglutathione lyase family enzyme
MSARLLLVFPQFRVEDVVKTAEYYRDVLGFEIDDYVGDPPVFTHVKRDFVSIQIGLAHRSGGPTRAPGGVGYNTYIWTDDVDALAAELKGRGADVIEGPVDRMYPCRELVVRDVNGLTLCFAQRRR